MLTKWMYLFLAVPGLPALAVSNMTAIPSKSAIFPHDVMCFSRAEASKWGLPAYESLCASTLEVLTHDALFRIPRHYGPGFTNHSWQAIHDPCHVVLKATSITAHALISLESITAAVHSILKHCHEPGYGGVKRMSENERWFFSGVYALKYPHGEIGTAFNKAIMDHMAVKSRKIASQGVADVNSE